MVAAGVPEVGHNDSGSLRRVITAPAVPALDETAWPAPVRDELRRRVELVPRRGEVLELGPSAREREGGPSAGDGRGSPPASIALVLDAAHGGGEGAWTGLRFDTVICAGALSTVPDLPLAVRGLRRRLADDGVLFVIEPVGGPGWGDVLVATALSGARAVRGQHLDRDIPAALRAGGLAITDLERFTMPTRIWSLRRFVAARAVGTGPTVTGSAAPGLTAAGPTAAGLA
jgi:hypothetical protein